MELESALNYFAAEGIWAILSAFLIFYILKNQEKRDTKQAEREEKYQEVISALTVSLQGVEEIKTILKDKLT